MGIHRQAFRDFIQRYATVWKNVWAVRDQLDPPVRDEDERAFLPAHLELTETPVSAAPKWAARLIMLFALIALAWSLIGKMDIVAVAQGKTTPDGRSKMIQPLETAVVNNIRVRNGDHVHAGQVVGTLGDKGYDMAQTAGIQLLSPEKTNGILYGPRSPNYQKQPGTQ